MEYREHREKSFKGLSCSIITVNSLATPETDKGGKEIKNSLEEAAHSVLLYRIVKETAEEIEKAIKEIALYEKIQVIILTGGTGLSRRDVAFETLEVLLDKRISGFGELFRHLCYKEIGPAAMMSRASAGIYHGKLIFSLPGSVSAVRLAMEKLILPELGFMAWDANR